MALSISDRISNLLANWVSMCARRPVAVLLLATILAGASLYITATRLGFNTNTDDMLSPKLGFRQAYSAFQREFPQFVGTILVVIDGDTPESARRAVIRLAARIGREDAMFADVFLPKAHPFLERQALLYLDMGKLQRLADKMAEMQPYLGRLASDTNVRGLAAMLDDAFAAVRDGERIELARVLRQLRRGVDAVVEQHRFRLSWQELMTPDADLSLRRQFLVVKPRLDYGQLLAAAPAIQRLRTMARELGVDAAHGLRMRLTGGTAMAYEELLSVGRGAVLTAVLASVTVALVLWLGLGSLRLVFATLFTLFVGLSITAAFATLAVGHLNLISVAFTVLYIGLGVDYAIHFILRYRELQQQGINERLLAERTAYETGLALLLCAVTTAIGFLCFVPTAYAGVSELGLISGVGMFISLGTTLSVLPAWLALLPAPRPAATPPSPGFTRLLDLPRRHRRGIRLGILMLGIAAAWLLPYARFDYNPVHMRDPDSESVATFNELMLKPTTSPWHIMVLERDESRARDIAARLKKLPSVEKAVFIGDLVPSRQQEKMAIIDDMALVLASDLWPTEIPPPPTARQQMRALVDLQAGAQAYAAATPPLPYAADAGALARSLAQLVLRLQQAHPEARARLLDALNAALFATLPDNLQRLRLALRASPFDLDDLPAEIMRRWVSPTGIHRIEVFPREDIGDNNALRRFVRTVQSVAPTATGAPVFTLEAGEAVVTSFVQAFLSALAAIFLLLLFILKSLRDSLLIVTPLLFAFALLNAAAVLLAIPFNFTNVIALPLLLGMGVDNGIHMVWRARQAMPVHGNLLRTATARSVLFSALTTLCSFGSLSFSYHTGTASMGKILSLGVLIILIGTLIVRPTFLEPRPAA